MPYVDFIRSLTTRGVAGIHGTLELKGLGERWLRPPYYSLSDGQMELLSAYLKSHQLL